MATVAFRGISRKRRSFIALAVKRGEKNVHDTYLWPGNCCRSAKDLFMRTQENGATERVGVHVPGKDQELDFSDFMQGLVVDTKAYVRAEANHLTLHAIEKASTLLSMVVRKAVVFIMLGTALLFLNIALAIYLGDQLGSRPLGFVLVAGTYLLLLAIFQFWWSHGGRERFLIDRINDLSNDD